MRRNWWIVALLASSGCRAPWHRMVSYSDQPAPVNEDLVGGIYRVLIREEFARGYEPTDSTVIVVPLEPSRAIGALTLTVPWVEGNSVEGLVPGYWADTLKFEAGNALADIRCCRADTATLLAVLRRLGVRSRADPEPENFSGPQDSAALAASLSGRLRRLWLSVAGFNRDSTIAAVHLESYCGGLCGIAETVLLARRPGKEWKVWWRQGYWVS